MATNWVRDYIPFYAELIAPLSDLLRKALAKLPKRTKAAASRVSLAKLGWNCTLEQAFNALKACDCVCSQMRATHTGPPH